MYVFMYILVYIIERIYSCGESLICYNKIMNESAVNHKANNSISKRVARRQTWKNNDNELRVNWTVHLIMKDIFFGKEEKKYEHIKRQYNSQKANHVWQTRV